MGSSHSHSAPVLLSRTPVERPFAQPSNRVLPTAETPRLRPTDNGSILQSGGTLRRRAHSEPELSTLVPSRIRSRKKTRAPQPPRRPLPPLPDGRYQKHRAKSLDREALCEAIEEAARKRRNLSFKMSLQHPAEREHSAERYTSERAHSAERYTAERAHSVERYTAERTHSAERYTAEREHSAERYIGEKGHSADRFLAGKGPSADRYTAEKGHSVERYPAEKVHSAERYPTEKGNGCPANRVQGHVGKIYTTKRGQVSPHQRAQVPSAERGQVYPAERGKVHSAERGQAHPAERGVVHPTEKTKILPDDRSYLHSVERTRMLKELLSRTERARTCSTEREHESTTETEKGLAYAKERGVIHPVERGRMHLPIEREKSHPPEKKDLATRVHSPERVTLYPAERVPSHPPPNRVHCAADWSSSPSGSEEELEIDLQLRPTLPRRLIEVSRFSPTDVWKSINLDFFKAHRSDCPSSEEEELMEEQRIRRVSRPVAPRRPATASADSGISLEPPWVPQQDLADSDSGGSEPVPQIGRGPPTFTLMFPSRSLPRPADRPPVERPKGRGLRLGLRHRRRSIKEERRLDPNWSLSRSLPNVVYLPGERSATPRRQERRALEAEGRRQQELDWMNRVEDEFRKQRDKEKQGIRLQLRQLQETTTGMKKWLKRPPRPDPEGGRSEGEDCNELYNRRNKSNDLDNGISNESFEMSNEISHRESHKRNYSSPKNDDDRITSRKKVGRELNSFSRNHPHRGKLQQRILSC